MTRLVAAAASALADRGTPVQQAEPGPSTCVQQICTEQGCVDNGVTFACLSTVQSTFDISFLGRTMRCDDAPAGQQQYPLIQCDCNFDPIMCDDDGVQSQYGPPSETVDGLTGYVAQTTVIGGPTDAADVEASNSSSSSSSSSSSDGGSSDSGAGGPLPSSDVSSSGAPAVRAYHAGGSMSVSRLVSVVFVVGAVLGF